VSSKSIPKLTTHYKKRSQKRKEKCLDFCYDDLKYEEPNKNLRRQFMATQELVCPVCEADIPLDGDERPGDLLYCSYCKMTFKMLKKKDNWFLEEDFEE
jgi:uncharacterized protein YbaR (Trm112 family)